MLYIYNTNSGAHLTKVFTPQSFSKNVRQLLRCPNRLEPHPVLLNTFTNEMVTNVDIERIKMPKRGG